jgi:O-antigen biosynthesis protein WbqV
MLMLGGPRILYRSWRDGLIGNFLIFPRTSHDAAVSNVLLIGASDAAELFIRSMQQSSGQSGYRVVGLLDSSDDLQGREIHGVPVLGRPADLDQVLERFANTSKRPQRLIFSSTLPQRVADGSVHDPQDLLDMSAEDLATKFERYGLSVARLPSITEFKDNLAQGQGSVPLKPIAIEDILGRPQTRIDLGSIEAFLKGRRVLVTGCGGTIGGELTRQIASYKPSELILLDNGEFNLYSIDFDIRDAYPTFNVQSYLCCIRHQDALDRIFEAHKPEIVFHAAALKHVPLVELNPTEGILTNVVGTKNVAEAALKHEALAMVQISTDKAVNPTNVMGASKRLGEYYAQALDLLHDDEAAAPKTRFMTVRFGNVLGSSGSVVPLFKKQLAKGGPLTVTHPEIKRYFMTVKEAVSLVLQASAQNIREQEKGNRGQIFVLDMGEPMKIVDVARQMIRLSDLRPDKDIKIVFTGLRPGEKLYEELIDRNEKPVSTAMDGVMAAIPQPINLSLLRKTVSHLEAQARAGDEKSILQTLASVVPGYSAEDYDDAAAQAKSKNQTKSKSKSKAKKS